MLCIAFPAIILVTAYYVLDWILHSRKIVNFSDKYVLISNCNTDLGVFLAQHLDLLGFHVFAGCQTEDSRRKVSDKCSSRVRPVALDATNEKSLQDLVQLVKAELPADKGIWAVVNTPGAVGNVSSAELLSRQDFTNIIETNLFAQMECNRHFLPLIRKTCGRIINMSTGDGSLAYSCATEAVLKRGVEAYSAILRRELYRQGVDVSVVESTGYKLCVTNVDKLVAQVQASVASAIPQLQQFYSADFFTGLKARLAKFSEEQTSNIDPVVDIFAQAVTAKRPRITYTVGWDLRLFNKLVSNLPDWAGDWLVNNFVAFM